MTIEQVLKSSEEIKNDKGLFKYLNKKVRRTSRRMFKKVNLSNDELKQVFTSIIKSNEQRIKSLVKEYKDNKGQNKYNDDGVWMDIGGLDDENRIISSLSL